MTIFVPDYGVDRSIATVSTTAHSVGSLQPDAPIVPTNQTGLLRYVWPGDTTKTVDKELTKEG